jgi:hypothetical protein
MSAKQTHTTDTTPEGSRNEETLQLDQTLLDELALCFVQVAVDGLLSRESSKID